MTKRKSRQFCPLHINPGSKKPATCSSARGLDTMQLLRVRWLKSCFGQPADDAAAAKSKDCDKSPSKPPATALGDALDTKASGGDVVTDALATAYEIVCSSSSPPTQHAHTSNTNPAQATVSAPAGQATGYAPRPAEPTASDPLDAINAIQTALPALPEVQLVHATFVTNTSRRRSTQLELPVGSGPIDSAEAFPVPIARRPPCARRSFSHRARDGPAVLRDASWTLQSRHSFTLSRNGSLQRSSPLAHMLNPVSPFNNALVALVKCSGEQVTGNMSPRLQRWCEIAEAIRSNSVTGTSPRPSAVRAKQVLLEEAEQLQQLPVQLQVQA